MCVCREYHGYLRHWRQWGEHHIHHQQSKYGHSEWHTLHLHSGQDLTLSGYMTVDGTEYYAMSCGVVCSLYIHACIINNLQQNYLNNLLFKYEVMICSREFFSDFIRYTKLSFKNLLWNLLLCCIWPCAIPPFS